MDGSTAQGHAGGQGGFEPTPQIIDMAEPAQFEQVAQADTTAAPATPRGSHKRHLRNQGEGKGERRTQAHDAPSSYR
jgi:hypothetical protein